jgi:hypothetical protein
MMKLHVSRQKTSETLIKISHARGAVVMIALVLQKSASHMLGSWKEMELVKTAQDTMHVLLLLLHCLRRLIHPSLLCPIVIQ